MYPTLKQREEYIATIYPVGRFANLLNPIANENGGIDLTDESAKKLEEKQRTSRKLAEKSLEDYFSRRQETSKIKKTIKDNITRGFLRICNLFDREDIHFVAQAYCDANVNFKDDIFRSAGRRKLITRYFEKRFSLHGEVKTQFCELMVQLLFTVPTAKIAMELDDIQADLDQYCELLFEISKNMNGNFSAVTQSILGEQLYQLFLQHGQSCQRVISKYNCNELEECKIHFSRNGLLNEYGLDSIHRALNDKCHVIDMLDALSFIMDLLKPCYSQIEHVDKLLLVLDLLTTKETNLFLTTGVIEKISNAIETGDLNTATFDFMKEFDEAFAAELNAQCGTFCADNPGTEESRGAFCAALILKYFLPVVSPYTSKLALLNSELDSLMCHRMFQMLDEKNIQSITLEKSHQLLMKSTEDARATDRKLILELEQKREQRQKEITHALKDQREELFVELKKLVEADQKSSEKAASKKNRLLKEVLISAQHHLVQDSESQASEVETEQKEKAKGKQPSKQLKYAVSNDEMRIVCQLMADDLQRQIEMFEKVRNSLRRNSSAVPDNLSQLSNKTVNLKAQIDKEVAREEVDHITFNRLHKEYEACIRKYDDLYPTDILPALKDEKESLKKKTESENTEAFINEVIRLGSGTMMEQDFGRGEWINNIPERSSYPEIYRVLHNKILCPKEGAILMNGQKRTLASTEKLAFYVTQRSSTPGAQFCISVHRWVVKKDIGTSDMKNLDYVNRNDWQDMQVLPGAPLSYYVFHVKDPDRP